MDPISAAAIAASIPAVTAIFNRLDKALAGEMPHLSVARHSDEKEIARNQMSALARPLTELSA